MAKIIVWQKEQLVELSINFKRLIQWWIRQHLCVVETLVPMRILSLFGKVSVNDPNLWIHHRVQELRLSQTSIWRILSKDFGLFPYKIQLTQQLKPNDHLERQQFADWAREQLEIDSDFWQKTIIFARRSLFLDKWLRKQAKLSHLGWAWSTRDSTSFFTLRKSHWLMWILVCQHHRTLFISK